MAVSCLISMARWRARSKDGEVRLTVYGDVGSIVTRDGGVRGEFSGAVGSVLSRDSDVELLLRAPLQVSVKSRHGDIDASGFEEVGGGVYAPAGAKFDTFSLLSLKTRDGDVSVTYRPE